MLYKTLSLASILLPVCDLTAYACVIRLPYLCKRIVALTVMLAIHHTGYALLFYLGDFSISAEKVYRSGYWIFETQQAGRQTIYLWLPMITLFLMVGCLAILLSFRLDLSMWLFPGKTIQKNLKLMKNYITNQLFID